MALPTLSCQLSLLCRNTCLSWGIGMDYPCCSLPAHTFFGHWLWKQIDGPLASQPWILERSYKYLAVRCIHSYTESVERKRRRKNNSLLKCRACKWREGSSPGIEHRVEWKCSSRTAVYNQSHASSSGAPGWAFQKVLSDLRAQLSLTSSGT